VADAFEPERVLAALEASWSSESSSLWSRDNPACGQCNVTALVMHQCFGGDILKTAVGSEWHFYNRVGERVFDFTSAQFATPIGYDDVAATAVEALAGTRPEQVEALRRRFALAWRAA
jgi:hypothetical protein